MTELSGKKTGPTKVWGALRSPTVKLTPGTKAKIISDTVGMIGSKTAVQTPKPQQVSVTFT